MADNDDPTRLIDDPETPAELRSLLTAARNDGLDAAALARVDTRVQERLSLGGLRRWRWWGLAGGVAALLAWMAAGASTQQEVRGAQEPSASIQQPVASSALQLTAALGDPPVDPAATTSVATAREPAVTRAPTRRAAKPAAVPSPTIDSASAVSSEEARLLLAARRKLAADPAAALAKTDEHVRRFEGGALAPERELVAIRALLALGRREQAEARAGRFTDAFPNSVHAAAVTRALALGR